MKIEKNFVKKHVKDGVFAYFNGKLQNISNDKTTKYKPMHCVIKFAEFKHIKGTVIRFFIGDDTVHYAGFCDSFESIHVNIEPELLTVTTFEKLPENKMNICDYKYFVDKVRITQKALDKILIKGDYELVSDDYDILERS